MEEEEKAMDDGVMLMICWECFFEVYVNLGQDCF